jgi:ribonuclease Z
VAQLVKTTFRSRLLNGQTGDPALLLTLRWQGRSLLIDLGRIDRTPASVLVPIERVFVSHAHMDHFMGFDQLLRLMLSRDTRLELYGPPGIAECVQGKLAGYTWNLTDEYVFVIDVIEIEDTILRRVRFAAAERFRREPLGETPRTGPVFEDEVFAVDAAPLDHRIVSMAYAVREHSHLNVRPERLETLGARPGRWLGELKRAVRLGAAADLPIEIRPGETHSLGALRDALLVETPGQKVAYVVDALFSPQNADRVVALARDADVFYCESPFLDADIDQATRRYHLTARQAGAMARAARVKRLNVFHFSPRYEGRYGQIVQEAQDEFQGRDVRYREIDDAPASVG